MTKTDGMVLHRPAAYDLLVWLATWGRERAFRDRLVRLARVERGEAVLDVGCGTGSLAIAATRQVGQTGAVHGIDASPEMIGRATKKARTAGVHVTFQQARVERLPFPDAHFDVVLSTVMLHHVSRAARQQGAREIRRVLKPGGRVLAVDFGREKQRGGFMSCLHFHRHGHVDLRDIVALLIDAGFRPFDSGDVGIRNLQFVLAIAPNAENPAAAPIGSTT